MFNLKQSLCNIYSTYLWKVKIKKSKLLFKTKINIKSYLMYYFLSILLSVSLSQVAQGGARLQASYI